jgi:serine/threonine protein kinase
MAMWTMKGWSFNRSRSSDVVPEADGQARDEFICELCELGEQEESHGIDTTHKLLLAIAEARDSCLRVQTRLMTEKTEFKINGEQAAYLKERLLWGLPKLLDPHSNVISSLQEQAVASISWRSASWRAECNQALLFCANILGELSRIMRIGEALIVDCVGSSKDWSQLVVLESILASRSDLVATKPEQPLWSPFYLVLREFHIAHIRLEKAIGELEESCGFTFNCIPPELAKKARDHRFDQDKTYCRFNAVKDTENLLKECTQLAKRNNKKSTKSSCANYMLNKFKSRDIQLPVLRRGGAGGGGSNPNPNQGASNPNHRRNSEFLRIDNEDLVGTSDPFAHGSFGYVTERKWFNIAVAVKTMDLELLEVTKFYEEVALLARVEHPHVVRLVGYCGFKVCNSGGGGGGGGKTTRTENKVVMEKMEKDLRMIMEEILENKERAHPEELEHHVPFPPPVALDIILQLAEALKFLRIQRVMHRDIKSKNILVNSSHLQQSIAFSTDRVVPSLLGGIDHASSKQLQYYRIKLTDLGLARYKLPENSLCSSKMQGSTNWRAPEVFKENPDKYTWAADIYSFAMTSYEIVSGKRPFWDVPTVTFDRLCAGERPCLPVNCQPELANLIQRCWATNADERPKISEVCDELQSCKEALLRRQLVWRNASGSCSATTG